MEKYSAIQFLLDDHKIIRGLFRQAEAHRSRAVEMENGVVNQLFMLLEVHSQLEQEVFYPVVNQIDHDDVRGWISEFNDDHDGYLQSIREMRAMSVTDPDFHAKLGDLIASFETHLDREETDLFRILATLDLEPLRNLEPQLRQKKEELINQPEYANARPEVVQNPNGGEQKRKIA